MSVSFASRTSSAVHHKLSDSKGLMKLSQFRLRPRACVSWRWEDTPQAIAELCLSFPGVPEFVTVVPACMRFTHLPTTAKEIFELKDGYIAFE